VDSVVKPATRAITLESVIAGADPLEIRSGPSIVPIERLKLFSSSDWEGFVNEWASSLGSYQLVERTSGSGDMGCDVIGTVAPMIPDSIWDNYQCKHYDHALAPTEIWIELAKFCYYTFVGAYSIPRRYLFVAPRGVGTKLARLLKKPAELKAGLLAVWAEKCAHDLIKGRTIELDDALQTHINAIDFSLFGHVPPLELIEGHAKTRYFFCGTVRTRTPASAGVATAAQRAIRRRDALRSTANVCLRRSSQEAGCVATRA